MKAKYGVIGGLVFVGLLFVSCDTTSTTSTTSAPRKEAGVSGLLDDTKGSAAKYKAGIRTVPDYRKQCTTKTRKNKHTSGFGRNKRTWYTNDSYQDCTKIKIGSHQEKYRSKIKDAKYCVELDNVNGDKSRDDVWFFVSYATYLKYADLEEGAKVKKMKYNHEGC